MQILPWYQKNLVEIARKLVSGATIIYPTETCYGLGCDATNAEAVKKLYDIKGRPEGKPFIVIVDVLERMAPYIEITSTLRDIEKKYWPGALTVVVDAKTDSGLPSGVIGTDGTIAFRVTSHPLARELASVLARPLVSTSANLAGEPNVYSAEVARQIFLSRDIQPDILIDAGDLPETQPSTVVRVQGERLTVLRQGAVKIL